MSHHESHFSGSVCVFLLVVFYNPFFFQWSLLKAKPCIFLNCHSHIHCFLLQIVIVPPVTHFLPASQLPPHTPTHTCFSTHTRTEKQISEIHTSQGKGAHSMWDPELQSYAGTPTLAHKQEMCDIHTQQGAKTQLVCLFLYLFWQFSFKLLSRYLKNTPI